ncbi:Phosphatidylglycerol/phosphatidylinositol transfer protein [Kluyveromyces marxianus]|nr:Phosphatidylglycerol/phosphatidylinositol transfer protein [Kluyveromyces marxianus]
MSIRSIVSLILFCALANAISLSELVRQAPLTLNRPIPGGSPLLQCDLEEPQSLDITSVSLDPNPPQRGENLTIVASGLLKTVVEEGAYVDVEVRLGYIKLLSQTYDLCEQLEENDVSGLKCPLPADEYDLLKSVEIPNEVPPGRYSFFARAYNADDTQITCLTGEIVFPGHFHVSSQVSNGQTKDKSQDKSPASSEAGASSADEDDVTLRIRIPPIERTGESLDRKRARLIYQSRKRGILETDLLLSRFAAKYLKTMSPEELQEYDELLNELDWDIYYWATENYSITPLPDKWKDSKMLKRLQEFSKNKDREILSMPDLLVQWPHPIINMSSKAPLYKLPPLPRLKVKKPIIQQEANRCLVLMSNLLQCWSSNGHMHGVCDTLVQDLKACTAENAMGKNQKVQKSNINYHAARLYDRVGGKSHD